MEVVQVKDSKYVTYIYVKTMIIFIKDQVLDFSTIFQVYLKPRNFHY